MVLYGTLNIKRISRAGNNPLYKSFDDVVKEGRDPKYNRQNPKAINATKSSKPYKGAGGGGRGVASELGPHTIDVNKFGYGYADDAKNGQKFEGKSKKEYLASKKK